MSLYTRLQKGWNAFIGRDPTKQTVTDDDWGTYGGYSRRPDRFVASRMTERSVVNAVYNRIANDVAQVSLLHALLDQNGRYVKTIESRFNRCLSIEANIDQTGRAFILDLVLTMFDEGVVAAIPIDTTDNPDTTMSYDIKTMRTAKVLNWYTNSVLIRVYDDRKGIHRDIKVPKRSVAIIENPFYTVMNEPNSTAKRLLRKLNLIDMMDEQNSNRKLDLIIQLPYVVKSEARRQQAEFRRQEIEKQLTSSQYGIAYTDGTEKIVQLSRPVENQLSTQVTNLQNDLYSQLGLTQNILNGSASDQELLNYYNRTVEPILSAIADEFKRKFLSKTAISQRQSVWFFRDPFKLVPVEKIASIADSFTRNEILSSNEVRAIVGFKPVDDPAANELRNKNINQSSEQIGMAPRTDENFDDQYADEYYEKDEQNMY